MTEALPTITLTIMNARRLFQVFLRVLEFFAHCFGLLGC